MRISNVSQRRLRKTRPFANTAVVTVQMVPGANPRIPPCHFGLCLFIHRVEECQEDIEPADDVGVAGHTQKTQTPLFICSSRGISRHW